MLTYWMVGFYIFCIVDIVLLVWTMRMISRSKFRSDEEGATLQVGYEEDSQGNEIPLEVRGVEAPLDTPEAKGPLN